jgi:hypothetical protein
MSYKIKNATVRKVKNKGFIPITVNLINFGFVTGWIYKTGTKWMHFYSYTTGCKRLPLNIKKVVL